MKKHYSLLLALFVGFLTNAQSPEAFNIEIEATTITNTPGIHSYSWGKTSDGKWVIIGGRIDGLHQRQPFAAFLEADNNKFVFVIDPINEESWSADLSVLSAGLFEQLQSTNQEFYQRDTTLYIIGGYGYSATAADHITFPNLTAVNINELADAVINAQPITSYFRQISDTRLKVTGGQVGYIDSLFYLAGGQLFDGRYNPMGPDMGPGFIQEYTNEIRTFKIDDDGTTMTIYDYNAMTDITNLHRRDYNMSKQIFPNGDMGFTMFSGVFDPNDMPYLNSVDITPSGYTVNNNFNQYLSQYHSAKIPFYDVNSNSMHTLFFGGMSQFYLDDTNTLIEDVDVPFVKTISKVTRLSDGSMTEAALNYIEMPALLGAGSEFIPVGDYLYNEDIIDINAIPNSKTLIGYIYGGIQSSDQNIFFINDGTQSFASNTIFKVYVNKSTVGLNEYSINENNVTSNRAYPNPAKKDISIDYFVPISATVKMSIIDSNGRIVLDLGEETLEEGKYTSNIDISELAKGTYVIKVNNGSYTSNYQFIKK